jgi:hypothetical protein
MKYKWATPFILMMVCFHLVSANPIRKKIDRAFEALRQFNYFDSIELFLDSDEDYPCIANFGLSIIYYRTDNPFHNIDSAYMRINMAISAFASIHKDEANRMGTFSVTMDTLVNTKAAIENFALAYAVSSKNIDRINHFLNVFNNSAGVPVATRTRDSIAFQSALKANSPEAYQVYMNVYPKSHLYFEAKARYDKTLYDESVSDGSEASFARFIDAYPNSPHTRDAMLKLYLVVTSNSQDPEVYHNFIQKYPANSQVDDAWQRIYELYLETYDEKSLDDFRNRFPDYPYMENLENELSLARETMIVFTEDSLSGIINSKGIEIVPPRYDHIGKFSEGIATVTRLGKMGYISKSGEEIIPPFYDDAENFHNNLAVVGQDGKYGVINRTGKMVVPLSFDEIGDYAGGLAVAYDDSLCGFINRIGERVIPFRYTSAGDFTNGFAICEVEDKFGVIDDKGNTVIPVEFGSLEQFAPGIFKFTKDEKYGFVSPVIMTPQELMYDAIGNVEEGKAVVIRNGKMGYADSTGNITLALMFDDYRDALTKSNFKNNLAQARQQSRSGVINENGSWIIAPKFEDVLILTDSLVGVKSRSKWGIMNTISQQWIVPSKYDQLVMEPGENLIVVSSGKSGISSYDGNILIPVKYQNITGLGYGLYVVKSVNKIGVSDILHQEILPVLFDSFSEVAPGFYEFHAGNEIKYLDAKAKRVFTRHKL